MARLSNPYSMNASHNPSCSLPPIPPLHSGHSGGGAGKSPAMASVEQLIEDISKPELREKAMAQLSKRKEIFQDLAPLLWNSFGTIGKLLEEIISMYRCLSTPVLETASAIRVCDALVLFLCVASHSETRIPFLHDNLCYFCTFNKVDNESWMDNMSNNGEGMRMVCSVNSHAIQKAKQYIILENPELPKGQAHIPLYLYPFLNITNKEKPYDYLRLTSLSVIGALLKADDTEVICYLLHTEIVPLCLRSIENGSELSQTVAIFIVQKILSNEVGLYYVCSAADRFSCVTCMLGTVVDSLADQPSLRLLKNIIRCFLRFSEDHRYCHARCALPTFIPKRLTDGTFENLLRNDELGTLWLQRLLFNVYGEITVKGSTRSFCSIIGA